MAEERGIRQRLDELRTVPVRIAAATNAASDVVLHRRTAQEPWSVNDVLAHLRAAADARERYMRRMATGEHSTLTYSSPRSEMRKTDYADRSFGENLAEFEAQRAVLVEWLEALPAEAWGHGALIRDRPESVATYAGYLAEHELEHCEQIEGLLG